MRLGTMREDKIDEILGQIPEYRGTFGKDRLKKMKPQPEEYLVINFDNEIPTREQKKEDKLREILHLEPRGLGTHWVAIANRPEDPFIVYFDSFGLAPPAEVLKYMRKSGKKVQGTTNEIQGISSKNCGWFCINFLLRMKRRESIYDILYAFGNNKSENDQILKKKLADLKLP